MISAKDYLKNEKTAIYNLYSKVVKKAEKYEDVTRSYMYEKIIDALKENYKLVYFLCEKEDLLMLKHFLDDEIIDSYDLTYFMGYSYPSYKSNIVEGYYEYVKKAVNTYFENEEECEKEKEIYYFIVGVCLTFGALYLDELTALINQSYKKNYVEKNVKVLLENPFVRKYASITGKEVYLTKMGKSRKYLLGKHSHSLSLNESKETIIKRGKDLFVINEKLYEKVKNIDKNGTFIKKYFAIDLIIYSGFNNLKGYFENGISQYLLSELSDEHIKILCEFSNSLPKWILKGNSCLSEENCRFFYTTYFGFVIWCAEKYGININGPDDNSCDEKAMYHLLETIMPEIKMLIDQYTSIMILTKREKDLLSGLKKGIFDTFIVVKFTNEGALFAGTDKVYLVKGLVSPFEDIFKSFNLPIILKTLLVPFEESIITNGIYSTMNATFGKTMKDCINKSYDTKNIITSL